MSQRLLNLRPALFLRRFRFLILTAAFLLTVALFTGFATEKITYLITDDDLIYTVQGYSDDISEAFIRADIVLNAEDTYDVTERDGFVSINVIRTLVTSQTSYESIPYVTIRRADPNLPIGVEQVVQNGRSGIRTTVTEVTTVTGREPVSSFLGVFTAAEPVTEVTAYGTMVAPVVQSYLSISDDVLTTVDQESGTLTTISGQTLPYAKALTCTATAYTTERQSWKITATGTTARLGAIAVDPKVIPYGTKLYIVSADGSITYGEATAEDCGGAIKGNKIDLFFNTYEDCINFGRRSCTVYILK